MELGNRPLKGQEEGHGQGGCEPKDIAQKSFFLGPQAENAEWVQAIVARMMERWFNWRRRLFPSDGVAISDKDLQTTEFQERRRHFSERVDDLVSRFEDEVPKFSPRYIGHMFSEISLPALFGHIATLLHNPNNISRESSRVGVQIEDEAILALKRMVGYGGPGATGHFTSGGTVANFEALMRARERTALWLAVGAYAKNLGLNSESLIACAQMGWERFDHWLERVKEKDSQWESGLRSWLWTEGNPWGFSERIQSIFGHGFKGPIVLVPENKHYSWEKGVSLLGLGGESFWPVKLDHRGKLNVAHLEERMQEALSASRPVMMVVTVVGTTELGEVDPVDHVNAWLEEKAKQGIHIWHHVDAAYGGYFCSLLHDEQGGVGQVFSAEPLSQDVMRSLRAISATDSITLDPHKLGYVPYASGAFLCRTKRDYFVKAIRAPYLQYDQESDRGPYTIEGSRSAAGAAATWMGAECIGLHENGYGRILARTVRIRLKLEEVLKNADLRVQVAPYLETNILCFTVAQVGDSVTDANRRAEAIYQAFSPDGSGPFFVSKTTLTWKSYQNYLDQFLATWPTPERGQNVVLVRITIMNPFFGSKEMHVDYFAEFVSQLKNVLQK